VILGLDFGTTNTGAAVFDGHSLNLLPLDPASQNPAICRTAMYFTRDGQYYFGQDAINRYFEQNLGRRTKLNRVWVGEIMQVFAELPTFYRDVYVYEDEFSPGRILLSIKTTLRNKAYFGTAFRDQWYAASDLVATFLMAMQERVRAARQAPARQVVLGRPVHFSDDPAEDEIAQRRLLHAAFKAGFEQVYLEYEPVAAARFYEQRLHNKRETALVFDFGGGTLDFTVMEIGVPSERKILATGGIPIAGDVFDQRLFRDSIPKHLGEGSSLASGRGIPPYIFDSLSDWQEVLGLNSPDNLQALNKIKQEAAEKDKIEALIEVVTSNYALMLFDAVEKAKVRLSSQPETILAVKTERFGFAEPLTRRRFERLIDSEYRAIKQRLHETLARSGLEPKQVDRVLRTGGSSQIPLFVRLLEDMFGRDKVLGINAFSSVTSGLAVVGHEIETGQAEYKAYTPDSVPEPDVASSVTTHRGVRPRVDLSGIRQQLQVTQGILLRKDADLPYYVLLALEAGGKLSVSGADRLAFDETLEGVQLFAENSSHIAAALLIATGESDKVLLITNEFKLTLVPARSMLVSAKIGARGIHDLLRLQMDEYVTAMIPWTSARRFMCLVTENGQVRRFEAALLAGELRQVPYFRLERKYKGHAAFLVQADEEGELLLGTSAGRIVRVPVRELGNLTCQCIKLRPDEQLTAAAFTEADDDWLAVSRAGGAMVLGATGIAGQNWRGARIVGFAPLSEVNEGRVFALLAQGMAYLLATPAGRMPRGKSFLALPLTECESIASLLFLER